MMVMKLATKGHQGSVVGNNRPTMAAEGQRKGSVYPRKEPQYTRQVGREGERE